MQTQEDHSTPIPALNVDSLKVDLVVIQDTCSEKEDSNSETASSKLVKECSLNFETKDVHAIKYKMSKAKERCMAYFRSLHSHLQVLSKADLKGTHVEHGFRREFMSIFGQDVDTFTRTMLLNVDQLQKQLDKDEFQEDGSETAFWVVNNQFQKFIDSKFTLDYDSQMTDTYFVEYTGLEVQHFRDTLLQHLGNVKKSVAERTRHQRQYERRVNKRQMQTQESKIDTGKALDADLVDTESIRTDSTVQDDSSRSGNDTDADDADIRPIYDEEPMAEVGLTSILEQCQVKSPMLDSSPDNQTTKYSKQSLESENILLKKTVAQFQKDFSRMEAHCIALELKYQNQALKSGQHGQILNETSNKAKIKKEIDVLETMNIELEHSVAKLRKENETLKKHYKDLYDSIKITRSKTIEQTTSLLANNADLKAQIQEKVFAIAALKNDLRKLKGNSVDTKFAKTSVLGKPVLQSLRNQSVVRQPNAFKSERPQMSKQRFASQVDVNNNLSRPVTQHYLPKRRESVFAKPDHMIASSESRNSSKNMPRFSSNDMVHNHYLDEAKKKTQERDRNSKTSVISSVRFQSTADGSKPRPRSNNQTPRSLHVSKSSCVTIMVVPKANHSKSSSSFSNSNNFVCSTCHKCVFNANHDACITKLLKEVNSHAKIQSHKTRNSNKPVDQKSHTQKPGRQIFTRHRFSPNKTFAVYEKTSPRSDLRWKPTGRIFKSVGLRWIPTGKLFDSCTSKDDSEPTHGSNVDIPNIHESKQTLDLSAGTSINVQKEQGFDLSACTSNNVKPNNLRGVTLLNTNKSQAVNKSLTPYPCDFARTFRVMLFSIHSDKWKSFQSQPQTDLRIHKDGDGDASFQLESNSLPHAHAQTTKTYYKHQDSRIMKAQELKTKTSAQTLIYKIFLQRYQVYQGRLLASFQDDAKYEHVGQDTRSQENGDSWVSVPQTTQENGTSVTKMFIPITVEEKINKKNDVKARSLLLMTLPNEHQLTFSQYPDAKSMFAAIKTRFRDSLDSIFNRLQKIVSRHAILGVMNKPEVETMSIDDLYNNFKIVEKKVNKSVGGSSGAQNVAFMTSPSTNSTNDNNTASPQVSTASPNVNATSPQVSTASVSDNTVYAFMVENLNGSNVLHQNLEQIHEDVLEAIDLKWQLSLLSMREKKYYQRTGKNIFINANDIAGYDKSKVECYNCHKLGHFPRECRAPRSKESFDWSDMADEQV
ncbi:gag-pol polyprotein [Tanacetum coccineum]